MSSDRKPPALFARGGSFWLVAPYAAWMAMMAVLPQTAFFYALRGVVTAALLVVAAWRLGFGAAAIPGRLTVPAISAGTAAGVFVLLVWIAPETWLGAGSPLAASDSPYSPGVCGWALTLAKLAASAFVIPVAEEMFFRKWLVDFAGFWWMVVLFAVEHGERWHVGAVTGVVYGLVARRFGLFSAIVAHVVTNLALGLFVVYFDHWQFW